MATTYETKQRISGIVAAYNQQVTQIREDLNLSPLGRRRALQTAYDTAAEQVGRLKSSLDTDVNGGRRALERKLFGLPAGADGSTVTSYRDAGDRIAQVKKPGELGDLMERAAGTGDDELVRAGFARAWMESRKPLGSDDWQVLVDEYVAMHPEVRSDAEALATLTTPRGATRNFLERMGMTVLKPRELERDEASFSDQAPARADRAPIAMR